MTDKPNVFRDMAAIAGGDFGRAVELMAGFTAFANSGLGERGAGAATAPKPVQSAGNTQPSAKTGSRR